MEPEFVLSIVITILIVGGILVIPLLIRLINRSHSNKLKKKSPVARGSFEDDSNSPVFDLNPPDWGKVEKPSGGFSFLTMGDGSTASESDGDITWHGEEYVYANAEKSEIRPKYPAHEREQLEQLDEQSRSEIKEAKNNNLKNILIVDDDRGCRESIRMVLKSKYNILRADDGDSGLEVLRESHVDLLITGIRMPRMSGIELLKSTRDRKLVCPILVLSGYGDLQTAFKCVQLGVFDYMEKPFIPDELSRTVGHVLEGDGRYKLSSFKKFMQKCDSADILALKENEGASELIDKLLMENGGQG